MRLIVSFLLMFTAGHLFAQIIDLDDDGDCVVWEVSGKVANSGSGVLLTEGAVVSEDDILKFSKKSTLTLIQKNQLYSHSKKGKVAVSLILQKPGKSQSAGMSNFFEMMSAAKGYVVKPKESEKPDAADKGWGKKDTILIALPSSSKIAPGLVTFNWSSVENSDGYSVNISNDAAGMSVIKAETNGTALTVDFSELNVVPGQTWLLRVVSSSGAQSDFVALKITDKAALQRSLADLKGDASFKNATEVQRYLMKAVALESAGYHSAARMKYKKVSAKHPRNSLLNRMYRAFLDRAQKGFAEE